MISFNSDPIWFGSKFFFSMDHLLQAFRGKEVSQKVKKIKLLRIMSGKRKVKKEV